ncbi:hypothetical protein [Streptomyces sp. NPDC096311]|uniref:hypothetical protein n=1 Tax=Streptomyces sp. NPDC096311 TaxID=3366083 RepID=UPI0037FE6D55
MGFFDKLTGTHARQRCRTAADEGTPGRAARAQRAGGRRGIGSAEAPGLTQTLAVSAVVGGVPPDLIPSQVYLSMLDVADPRKQSVIRLALTAAASQHPTVLDDFRDFVRTVRPEAGVAS